MTTFGYSTIFPKETLGEIMGCTPEYFANIDRLGNLVLLEAKLNKQCQNKLINQKAQYYQ